MTEEQSVEPLKHTVAFGRTKNLGNYNSAKSDLFIQFSTAPDAPLAEIFEEARKIQNAAKAEVLEWLGIDYQVSDDGTVSEPVATPPPRPVAGPAEPQSPPGDHGDPFGQITEGSDAPRNDKGVGAVPPFSPDTKDKMERALNKKWAQARLATHPDEFYDNREKKESGQYKPNASDYTHKETRIPLWL